MPIAILAQIGSTLRRFAAAARLIEQAEAAGRRLSLRQALEEAGFKAFTLSKAESQLRQIGRVRAARLYRWLLDADLALKGSSSSPRAGPAGSGATVDPAFDRRLGAIRRRQARTCVNCPDGRQMPGISAFAALARRALTAAVEPSSMKAWRLPAETVRRPGRGFFEPTILFQRRRAVMMAPAVCVSPGCYDGRCWRRSCFRSTPRAAEPEGRRRALPEARGRSASRPRTACTCTRIYPALMARGQPRQKEEQRAGHLVARLQRRLSRFRRSGPAAAGTGPRGDHSRPARAWREHGDRTGRTHGKDRDRSLRTADLADMVKYDLETVKSFLNAEEQCRRVEHRQAVRRRRGNGGHRRRRLGAARLELAGPQQRQSKGRTSKPWC